MMRRWVQGGECYTHMRLCYKVGVDYMVGC